MNTEEKEKLWRAFWDRPALRKWTTATLRGLGFGKGVVNHWLNHENYPSAENVSQLVTARGLLSQRDKLRLAEVKLLTLGFTRASFDVLAEACRKSAVAPLPERKHILALCPFPGRSRIYFSELLAGLNDRATKEGYTVHVQPIPNTRDKRPLQEYYPHLNELRGVVAFTCHVEGSTWLDECREAEIPIVLVHDNIKREQIPTKGGRVALLWESMTGLNEAVDHLTSPSSYHCKQIRVIMARPRSHVQRERKLAEIIKVAVEKNKVQFDDELHVYNVPHYSYADGRRVCEQELAQDHDAEAIICLQDDLAHAVFDFARSYDKPLRITGYDNSPVASDFNLSSVDQCLPDTGEEAFNQLQHLVYGHFDKLPIALQTPTRFHARSSSTWTAQSG